MTLSIFTIIIAFLLGYAVKIHKQAPIHLTQKTNKSREFGELTEYYIGSVRYKNQRFGDSHENNIMLTRKELLNAISRASDHPEDFKD